MASYETFFVFSLVNLTDCYKIFKENGVWFLSCWFLLFSRWLEMDFSSPSFAESCFVSFAPKTNAFIVPLFGSGWSFWVGMIVVPKRFFCNFATECSPSHKAGLLGIYLRVSVKRKNNFCVRRRRTCVSRAVFTEITLKGFMKQTQGDRSWCHAISGIGRHFGLPD